MKNSIKMANLCKIGKKDQLQKENINGIGLNDPKKIKNSIFHSCLRLIFQKTCQTAYSLKYEVWKFAAAHFFPFPQVTTEKCLSKSFCGISHIYVGVQFKMIIHPSFGRIIMNVFHFCGFTFVGACIMIARFRNQKFDFVGAKRFPFRVLHVFQCI